MRTLKVAILGQANTGKSALVQRINQKEPFQTSYHPTLGAAYISLHVINQTTSDQTKLEIWDTSGQELYKSLMPMYYRGAHIVLLTFCNRASFQALKPYITELQSQGSENLSIIIVRTKSDAPENQEVPDTEVTALQQERDIPQCQFNTSAKNDVDCDTLFEKILALPSVAKMIPAIAPRPTTAHSHTTAPSTPQKKSGLISLFSRKPTPAAVPRVTVAVPRSRSLLADKDTFIRELSDYKLSLEERIGFSKREKNNVATKAMACFYGADIINFSKNERHMLKSDTLGECVYRSITGRKEGLALGRSLTETSRAVRESRDDSYQKALIQFLSDYKAMRNSYAKEYYLFNLGCAKTIKVSATDKLIARLKNEPAEPFTPEEIHALNDGTLKKTIETTLDWFSKAPRFDIFMREHGANQQAIDNHNDTSSPDIQMSAQ